MRSEWKSRSAEGPAVGKSPIRRPISGSSPPASDGGLGGFGVTILPRKGDLTKTMTSVKVRESSARKCGRLFPRAEAQEKSRETLRDLVEGAAAEARGGDRKVLLLAVRFGTEGRFAVGRPDEPLSPPRLEMNRSSPGDSC